MAVDLEPFINAVVAAAPSRDEEGLTVGLRQVLATTEQPTECLEALLLTLELGVEQGRAKEVFVWCAPVVTVTQERYMLTGATLKIPT